MIRLADYVAQYLDRSGVRCVFMVTGGGAMHLNDAFGRCQRLKYVCLHHEQSCAIAAESFARFQNELAVVNVTSGPGAINALNGVFGAWTDSIPMLVISGQVKKETLLQTYHLNGKLRQLGDQEADIIAMVKGITKYAHLVDDPDSIRYHLEKALYLAHSGRPGPCWLDIPLDIQAALIDDSNRSLPSFTPPQANEQANEPWLAQLPLLIGRLAAAERPLLLAGNGVHLSNSRGLLLKLLEAWQIPLVTGFNAHDLVWDEHPCYVGRPGTIGERAGNFCVQNADVLLVLGSRLNIRQVSYNWKSFARNAYKIVLDIDSEELGKPLVKPDMPIQADLHSFLRILLESLDKNPPDKNPAQSAWLNWCKERKNLYPVVLPQYWHKEEPVNPYCFVDALFNQLEEGQIVVTANATACIATFQAAKLKPGQRLWSNSGNASMGYDLPAAIGACLASGLSKVVCLAGDGSIMMNIQELESIAFNQYPIKIFLLNNHGYHSILQTQQNYFADNIVGCNPLSHVGFPDFAKIARAFNIDYFSCSKHSLLAEAIGASLDGSGPAICQIFVDPAQPFSPKLLSQKLADGTMLSPTLENMWPFLSQEELAENMSPGNLGSGHNYNLCSKTLKQLQQ